MSRTRWYGVIVVAAIGWCVLAAQAGKPMFADQFADLPGVRVRYQDTGPGREGTIVFMHAGTGNSESWAPQLEVFSKAGYRAVAYDRRGWGGTVANPETGAQPGASSDDLQALVEHLKIDKFHLVGLAAGARVEEIDYASFHGDRLLTMVLDGSLGPGGAEKELSEFSRRVAIPSLNKPEDARYREVGPSLPDRGGNPDGFKRWLEIEEHYGISHAQPADQVAEQLRQMEAIKVRTLVMPGDADLLSPPAFVKLWAAHIKDANGSRSATPGTRSTPSSPRRSTRRCCGSSRASIARSPASLRTSLTTVLSLR